ncbi:ATP-dependent Zn protease [Vibrio breoganii]|uniref:ATP-dependent zinc protease n=1 Tax=Vibrio breoganii TaxID=553239 RepID=A0ABX1U2X2_9VIBR|nr:ATP-dependent zinc protease [Vibrio breoganii]NMO72962.1 ATP-dependent zinc protease [Vibrio breoganii]NMR68799.1 ATP-dependent zinc protease [Vibrio breoganii]PMG03876.1 ATP-dependent Zn protease [Vibrio breoganii]PML91047.1 ATP-dependent Zn protease [Vibrio breoganii]TKG23133.1 ATP-dependent zinc protease [Vibrio breoganii]
MKHWKILSIALFAGSLVACSSTPQESGEEEIKFEQPVMEQETEEAVEEVVEKEEPVAVEEEKEAEPAPAPTKTEDGKLILGEQEWLFFPEFKATVKARVDSGATTSSLSAIEVKQFERDGKKWVKFKPAYAGKVGKEISLPIERFAKVKQSSSEESDKRPVVAIWIQLSELNEKTEFTLVDRSHLDFPVLLGRSFVRDVAIVDVSRKYVQPKITK